MQREETVWLVCARDWLFRNRKWSGSRLPRTRCARSGETIRKTRPARIRRPAAWPCRTAAARKTCGAPGFSILPSWPPDAWPTASDGSSRPSQSAVCCARAPGSFPWSARPRWAPADRTSGELPRSTSFLPTGYKMLKCQLARDAIDLPIRKCEPNDLCRYHANK